MSFAGLAIQRTRTQEVVWNKLKQSHVQETDLEKETKANS